MILLAFLNPVTSKLTLAATLLYAMPNSLTLTGNHWAWLHP
jgi:hypothetical protein